jgi:hypothetical protein
MEIVQAVPNVPSFDTRLALLRMNGFKYPFHRVSPQRCIEGLERFELFERNGESQAPALDL